MLTCVVAADHPGVRASLRTVLELFQACTIVGEAATGHEALTLTQRLQPDVLLVDLAHPATERLQIIRRVRAEVPTTGVVVLAQFADAAQMQALEQAGAATVVLKQAPATELLTAIEQATAGRH